jgi:hypothetical protein
MALYHPGRKAIVIALLLTAGTASAQERKELGRIESEIIFEASADTWVCSAQSDGQFNDLAVGYIRGYEEGLIDGAGTMQVILTNDTDRETVKRVIQHNALPALTYGAFSSKIANICYDYPTGDVRDVLAAAVRSVHAAMTQGD